MLFFPATLPLYVQTLTYTAAVIRRHRKTIGSCRRKLNSGRQALLVLAYLRKGETFAWVAAGFGIGTAGCGVTCGPGCGVPAHTCARRRIVWHGPA
jgi:hypothetical protein